MEGGTPSQSGCYPDISTMFFNQPFGNGEPQACSTMLSPFDLVEFIEDHLELVFRDAHAGISNLEESRLILLAGCD